MTRMSMWTVYDHPRDFPEYYVAREFSIGVGTHRPTTNIVMSTDLDMVRGVMEQMNLTPTPRWPEDDPKIIEVWL